MHILKWKNRVFVEVFESLSVDTAVSPPSFALIYLDLSFHTVEILTKYCDWWIYWNHWLNLKRNIFEEYFLKTIFYRFYILYKFIHFYRLLWSITYKFNIKKDCIAQKNEPAILILFYVYPFSFIHKIISSYTSISSCVHHLHFISPLPVYSIIYMYGPFLSSSI